MYIPFSSPTHLKSCPDDNENLCDIYRFLSRSSFLCGLFKASGLVVY